MKRGLKGKIAEGSLVMDIKRMLPFSLRLKTIVILIMIFVVMGIIGLIISNSILLQAVLETEKQLVSDNINRVQNIFKEEVTRLKMTSLDWGYWDDTYTFTLDKNLNYIKVNLMEATYTSNKWSYFFIFNANAKLIYGQGYNMKKKELVSIPRHLNNYFYPGGYFFTNIKVEKPVGGLALINDTLQFVASTEILRSDRSGPMVGYTVITREFSSENLLSFSKNMELPIDITFLNTPQSVSNLGSEFLTNRQIIDVQSEEINVKILINDVKDQPIAIISFKMPRNTYKNSAAAIDFFLWLLALTGLTSLICLGLLINFSIINRVKMFNKQIAIISEKTAYHKRVNIGGNDELTSVATQFNLLLDVIQNSQKKLQKKMDELRKLEEDKRKIIEYTPEPIIIINDKAQVKLMNSAVKKAFECQINEMQNQSIDEIFSLQVINQKGILENVKLSTQESPELGKEYLFTYKDKTIPIELKTSLIDNHSKIYIIRDISERKKNEQELSLLNQKLILVSREAGMSDVSRMLLHNIGNILNSVLVTLSLMKDDIKNSRLNYLEQIGVLFEQHIDTIGDFLTHDEKGNKIPQYMILLGEYWSKDSKNLLVQLEYMDDSVDKIIVVIKKFQFHHTSIVLEKIVITDLLDNALDIHMNRFKKDGIELVKHYSPVPIINQDRFKIWHILTNLITNAIDAVKAGESKTPRVDLFLEESKKGVRLKVTDNGVGIAENQLVTIFLFHHTSKLGGSGVGLHSSSILAKEIGATLTVHSKGVGKGATFILDIPRVIPEKNT